eukprot:CAMPEP_0172693652 /NCGR_PEP_ID=MMETSP1074-20121228/26143_1 /TAXON_ID=2916 /ORGANISM="Ceratium fusus, Strain PA161109" /LENGTH=36 /DNA_ID= /DNA_START= /DNA_END= /DNA_ORIENTATION=
MVPACGSVLAVGASLFGGMVQGSYCPARGATEVDKG